MPRLITKDDFIDLYVKLKERGLGFILSKFALRKNNRTKSAFNNASQITMSNWWIIPAVRKRWNKKISGNPDIDYKDHYMNHFVKKNDSLKLLSLGSGNCSNELKFASFSQFEEIVCIDFSNERLKEAASKAAETNLNNIQFVCEDFYTYNYPEDYFDIVLFNASLHHFKHVQQFLETNVKKTLKPQGRLIINEYVGPSRMQYPDHQIKAINEALKLVDKPLRTRHKTSLIKNKFHGHGLIRMIISDPSEAIDSANILSAIHKNFGILEEKPYGGNILAGLLKDIAHHFIDVEEDKKKEQILNDLFAYEDQYIEKYSSDFIFGVYEKCEN